MQNNITRPARVSLVDHVEDLRAELRGSLLAEGEKAEAVAEIEKVSRRHAAPSIPPTNPALRPLVGMLPRSIEEFGCEQTGLLCAQGFLKAVRELRAGDPDQVAMASAHGVTEQDLFEMALWLERRGVELCGGH